MKIAVLHDHNTGETRSALIPIHIEKLVKAGAEVSVESGLGSQNFTDKNYEEAGAHLSKNRSQLLSDSDMIIKIRKPELSEIGQLKPGCIHISYLDPYNEQELVKAFAKQGVTAISIEMIPRTTKAQKMDALSSQASLAGYAAVLIAAERIHKVFPMMMTPAGTISPCKVFVIGAGVAGLQAIATAKRLGAKVEAFDTRPVVKEQVQSLGAKFVEVDLGETGQTKDGYAKALTPDQLAKQQEAMAKVCANSDVVITTAQLFGRKAPVIVTEDMVKSMKPGSLIVDLAIESGGNVAGAKLNEEVDLNGVRIIGLTNLPGQVSFHASQMLSANFVNLIDEFWNKDSKSFVLKMDDEILQGCVITQGNEIVNNAIKAHVSKEAN